VEPLGPGRLDSDVPSAEHAVSVHARTTAAPSRCVRLRWLLISSMMRNVPQHGEIAALAEAD
jgi:hypothetical protein